MNDLIISIENTYIGNELTQTVNARDLHVALRVNRDFSNWIRYQLEDFEENQDFVVFAKSGENPKGGRPSGEYAVTLDTAKHICMMSRCEKGKQLRQYFIDAEKKY